MSPRAYLAQRSSRHGRMYISDEITGTLSTGTVKKVAKCFLLEIFLDAPKIYKQDWVAWMSQSY